MKQHKQHRQRKEHKQHRRHKHHKQSKSHKHKQEKRKWSQSSSERQQRNSIKQEVKIQHKNIDQQINAILSQKYNNQQFIQKQLPCFQPSGILLQYYNSRDGVVLKFHEPPEARKPVDKWRIYPFKGQQSLNPILLSNSNYLVGKDQRVCDILCQNPSISRQHAVIQFRLIMKMNLDGTYDEFIQPYVMDLDSTNGTILNDQKIESSRFVQILDQDIVKFGLSERQYVFVKEQQQ